MRIAGFLNGSQAGRTQSLLPGKIYTFRVLSVRGQNATLVLHDGTRLRVSLDKRLQTGQIYRARAVVRGNQTTVLQLVERNSGTPEASRAAFLGLPETEASNATVRAFMAAGLPLEQTRLERVLRRVEKENRRSTLAERARLGAMLEEKGLSGEQSWLYMLDVLGYAGYDHHDGRRGEEQPDEPAIETQLLSTIRFSQDGDHPLQLFNHIIGPSSHWIVLPFAVRGTEYLSGTIRLQVEATTTDSFTRRLEFRQAIVDVISSSGRRAMRLSRENGALCLSHVSGQPLEGKAINRLSERLADLGVKVQQTPAPSEDGEFDGFSILPTADILRGTDRTV